MFVDVQEFSPKAGLQLLKMMDDKAATGTVGAVEDGEPSATVDTAAVIAPKDAGLFDILHNAFRSTCN
jgi:hypothetical protein